MLGLDAAAFVAHRDHDAPGTAGRSGVGGDPDPDCSTRIAVLDRVVDQVDQCLLEERCVDLRRDRFIAGDVEPDGTVVSPGEAVDRDGREQVGDPHRLFRQVAGAFALLDAGEGQ